MDAHILFRKLYHYCFTQDSTVYGISVAYSINNLNLKGKIKKNPEWGLMKERKRRKEKVGAICCRICVCVRVCAHMCRQLPGTANACWLCTEPSWKHAQSPSPSQPGWHAAPSAAGMARCLSHKGTIKERWYLAATLSSRFPQLTVASVEGSPLLVLPL